MKLHEQRLLFIRAKENKKQIEHTLIVNSNSIRYNVLLKYPAGDVISEFEGNFSKWKLRKFLKTLKGCPRLLDSIWEWREFILNNIEIMPEYLPLKEITNKTII